MCQSPSQPWLVPIFPQSTSTPILSANIEALCHIFLGDTTPCLVLFHALSRVADKTETNRALVPKETRVNCSLLSQSWPWNIKCCSTPAGKIGRESRRVSPFLWQQSPMRFAALALQRILFTGASSWQVFQHSAFLDRPFMLSCTALVSQGCIYPSTLTVFFQDPGTMGNQAILSSAS